MRHPHLTAAATLRSIALALTLMGLLALVPPSRADDTPPTRDAVVHERVREFAKELEGDAPSDPAALQQRLTDLHRSLTALDEAVVDSHRRQVKATTLSPVPDLLGRLHTWLQAARAQPPPGETREQRADRLRKIAALDRLEPRVARNLGGYMPWLGAAAETRLRQARLPELVAALHDPERTQRFSLEELDRARRAAATLLEVADRLRRGGDLDQRQAALVMTAAKRMRGWADRAEAAQPSGTRSHWTVAWTRDLRRDALRLWVAASPGTDPPTGGRGTGSGGGDEPPLPPCP